MSLIVRVWWHLLFISLVQRTNEIGAFNSTYENNFTKNFIQLLERLEKEARFSSVFWLRRKSTDCMAENIAQYLNHPLLSLAENATLYWKGRYNSEVLAILCLSSIRDIAMLQQLAGHLQHIRGTRILTLLNVTGNATSRAQLEKFFRFGMHLRMPNVLLLQRDCFNTQLYYGYSQFPRFHIEQRSFETKQRLFPPRLSNVKGHILLTLPDQIEPRTMLYTDAAGNQRMTGYIGKLMHAFAHYINASLQLPYPFNNTNNQVIYLSEVSAAAHNGSIDIGASLSPLQTVLNLHKYSNVPEISQWLIMLPIRYAVPTNVLLRSVFRLHMLLSILLLYFPLSLLTHVLEERPSQTRRMLLYFLGHDKPLRGFLGQAFEMQRDPTLPLKYVYFLTFLMGLLFSTYFSASFIKLLTVRPLKPEVTSFEEALEQGIQVRIAETEIKTVVTLNGQAFWDQYKSAFTMVKTYDDFQFYRRTMAVPYAYPVTTSLWPVIKEQQRYFTHDLYALSEQWLLCGFMPFVFPLHENSLYRDVFNEFIGRVQETGLYDSWFHMTFYDMVALRKIAFADLSTFERFRPLDMKDFYWIWSFYVLAVGFCLLEFSVEVYFFKKFKRIFNKN